MKKTKLLTSLSALLLVLSVGACDNNVTEDSSSEGTTSEETTTSESSITGDTEVSTEGAYALYGDFVDSSWNESPDTSSKYFIPAGTEEYKVTVTIAGEPVDNEWWTEDNQWDAGFRVIEYGDYDALVVGSDDLDENSTGVIGSDSEKNIKVNWNTTYYITITFGETPSILVQEELEPATDPAGLVENAVLTGNYSVQVVVDEWVSDSISVSDQASGNYDEDELFESMTGTEYVINAYYTEDALLIDYYYNLYGYLIPVEEDLYVNTTYMGFIPCCDCYFTEDGETWYYYGSYTGYEWQDLFYSLFDNSWIGFEDSDFALLGSDVDSDGDAYDVYDFYDSTAMYYFGLFVGSDLWTSTWVNNFGYLSWFDYIYFYPELQMMCTSYYGAAWFYTDSTRQNLEIIEDDFYTTFYDVGDTEIDEELISYVEENAVEYE